MSKPTCKRVTCDSCQLVRVNGVVVHELGCPEAWRDQKRKCKWCGGTFSVQAKNALFCSDSCAFSYHT